MGDHLRFERIDEDTPPFKLQDVRDAISDQYFQSDTFTSLYYFGKDYVIIFSLFFIMYLLDDYVQMAPWLIFPVYWFCQGTMFWALFVIGHDCGHGSFSDSTTLNNFIGHLSHTPILVPFHSWRISHHKHHMYTSSVRNDESFVAVTESHYDQMLNIVKIIRYYTYPIAGYTMYLFVGMPKSYYSHFNPNAKIFKEKSQVTESITWVAAFGLLLLYFTYQYSFVTLFNYYLMPYFVFVAWIGIVTHFHHTHRDVPWYRDEDWTYLKGALSTIDRNYGVIEDIHHNIGTHIVHHLFMKIPHYNLKKATEQIKPVIGNYYKKSQVGFLKNMTEIFKYCRFVPNEGKRVYYTTKEHQREKQNQH